MHGLIVPSVTPFKHSELDLEGVSRLCQYYRERQVRYLFPIGTTGEFPLLTSEERQALLEAFVQGAGDDITVIAHVGAASTREALALSAHAASLGVQYAAAVTPYFFAHDEAMLVRYYQELCAAQPEMQFFAYTIPQRTGNTLSVAALRELSHLPNLIGIKDSTGDLNRLRLLVQDSGLQVVAGADQHALPFLQAGGLGFVSGPGSIIPELFHALTDAYTAGDQARSAAAFDLICEFAELIGNGGRIDLLRAGLLWRGIDTGQSREPLTNEPLGTALRNRLNTFADHAATAGFPLVLPSVVA